MAEQETFEIDAADLEDDDVADVSAPREAPLEQFEDETGDEDGTGVAEALRASTAGGRSVESESSGGRNSARPVCPTRTPGGAKNQPSLLTYEQRIRRYYGRARTAGYMSVRELQEMKLQDVIDIDKLAGEAFDILINKRPFAEGEIVVTDLMAVRITRLIDRTHPDEDDD